MISKISDKQVSKKLETNSLDKGTDLFRGSMVLLAATSLAVVIIIRGFSSSGEEGVPKVAGTSIVPEDSIPNLNVSESSNIDSSNTTQLQDANSTDAEVLNQSTSVETTTDIGLKVMVANGTGEVGIASKGKSLLEALDYETTYPRNTKKRPVEETKIYYRAGKREVAERLRVDLEISQVEIESLSSTNSPVDDTSSADLIIVLGKDKVWL